MEGGEANMKKFKIGNMLAIMAVAVAVVAIPATVMAALNVMDTTATITFDYEITSLQTRHTDAIDLDVAKGTTARVREEYHWSDVKTDMDSGYYLDVAIQNKNILGFWRDISTNQLKDFTTSTLVVTYTDNVPIDKEFRFNLYSYSVNCKGSVAAEATY